MNQDVLLDGLDHRYSLPAHVADQLVQRKLGREFAGPQEAPDVVDGADGPRPTASGRTMHLLEGSHSTWLMTDKILFS